MGLDISSPNKSVSLEAGSDDKIFELLELLGIEAPELKKIGNQFWDNPNISSLSQVKNLLAEVERLRRAYEESLRQKISREKNIQAKDAKVREQILAPLLLREPLLVKIIELEEVCRDAVNEQALLVFCSD